MGHIRVILGLYWECIGVVLGLFWDCKWIILGTIRVTLGLYRDYIWVYVRVMLRLYRDYIRVVFGLN